LSKVGATRVFGTFFCDPFAIKPHKEL
jgi:hypothetical protein